MKDSLLLGLVFFIGLVIGMGFSKRIEVEKIIQNPKDKEKIDRLERVLDRVEAESLLYKNLSDSTAKEINLLKEEIKPVGEKTTKNYVDSSLYNSEIDNAKKIEETNQKQTELIKIQSLRIKKIESKIPLIIELHGVNIEAVKKQCKKDKRRAFFRGVGVGVLTTLAVIIIL